MSSEIRKIISHSSNVKSVTSGLPIYLEKI